MGQSPSCADDSGGGCGPRSDPRTTRNNVAHRKELLHERIIHSIKADNIERFDRLVNKGLVGKSEKVAPVANDPDCCCVPPTNSSNAAMNPPSGPIDVHTFRFDGEGNTLLHVASSVGSVDIVRYLIESRSMDVNLQSTATGATAVHLACLANHLDVVVYMISVLAKLNIPDHEGKFAIDYCQSQNMKELIERNMRHEGAVNELSPDLDYGHFKWNKDDRFDAENPLRSSGRVKKVEKVKANGENETAVAPSCFYTAPSYNEDLDDTTRSDDDVHLSLDQKKAPTPNDSIDTEVIHDDESEKKTDDVVQSTPPPRPISLPVPRIAMHDDNDGVDDDDDDDGTTKLVSPTSVTVSTSAEKGTTGINSPLYKIYRKDDILSKLSSKNRSGRATSVGRKAIPAPPASVDS